jgi:hypothetical protein
MRKPRRDSRNSFGWVMEIGVIKKLMKLIPGAMKGTGDTCTGRIFLN